MKSVINTIKKSFSGQVIIGYIHFFQGLIMPKLISDEKAVMRGYKKATGKDMNLQNPTTFCEKINWYKLKIHDPRMTICADKYAVREYVAQKGYADNLNQLYGVYSKVNEIDIDALPKSFVLKAAHGTHMGIIVKNKDELNWRKAKKLLQSWLIQDIYWRGREWAYKDVPHRIIAEQYLEDQEGELKDYKFFCFHGTPYYMQYDMGRYKGKHYRNYYDMDLNWIDDINDDVPSIKIESMPLDRRAFNQMKEMAADLSSVFQQVRVDFYYVNGKIYFGEMTFYHNGGGVMFQPEDWDVRFGENWHPRMIEASHAKSYEKNIISH